MLYIYTFIIGYLFGSIPTAYIILKRTHGLDITKSGSGNVGAMNSFHVSKSKKLALLVLFIDALKGWLPVYIVFNFISGDYIFPSLALTAAIIGHCYSPWLKFKGGRGLATAAGGGLFITIPVLLTWALVWGITFFFQRNIHTGNISASVFSIIASIVIPGSLIKYSFLQPGYSIYFTLFVTLIMLIILLKHLKSIQELIKKAAERI